jgi:hypothetical protein
VAHQYFAGVVGADCRKHPAVDEPLAQFAAGEYMKQVYGKVVGQRLMDLNAKANYGIYRMLGGDDMVAAYALDQYPSPLAYAAIVYGKAPYFYVDLRRQLGAKPFDHLLKQAIQRNRFKMVTLQQWLMSMRGATKQTELVDQLAKRYFFGKSGDQDLGVDDSGDAVLGLILDQQSMIQLKQGLGQIGLQPKTIFRMLLRKMIKG